MTTLKDFNLGDELLVLVDDDVNFERKVIGIFIGTINGYILIGFKEKYSKCFAKIQDLNSKDLYKDYSKFPYYLIYHPDCWAERSIKYPDQKCISCNNSCPHIAPNKNNNYICKFCDYAV